MEQAGWLVSSWGESETNRKANFYRLTRSGTSQLNTQAERWRRISLAMTSALET
jgi:DNA-binding PadR family transcriptional regulator